VNFTALESPSLQFLPRQSEAPGWTLQSDPIVIPANQLDTYLDNDAQTFARYEAIDATIGKYAGQTSAAFAVVEIYRFPDFVKSFGAYSLRKSDQIQFLPIENEAFSAKHSIHLWRGPFYVRVIGGGTPDGMASLTRLTAFVAERMPKAPGRPAVFGFFPADARIAGSERYSAENGFGQKFLANSFQASFNVGGDVMDGLIVPAANKIAAKKLLDSYRQLYLRNGKLLDSIPNLGEDNFTAEDKYLGRAVAFRIDRFLIAFNGYKERQKLVDLAVATDAKILVSIRKQLVRAEEPVEQRPENPNAPPWRRP